MLVINLCVFSPTQGDDSEDLGDGSNWSWILKLRSSTREDADKQRKKEEKRAKEDERRKAKEEVCVASVLSINTSRAPSYSKVGRGHVTSDH